MDTPGINPTEDIYKHNFMIKEALISQPFNVIFVMVPFHFRITKVYEEFENSISMLKDEYLSMIKPIISKMDTLEINPEETTTEP